MKCETCECLKRDKEIVLDAKYWRVILSTSQSHLGRCVIDLKRHAPSLSELKEEEIMEFLIVVKKLEKAIKKSFKATMFNLVCLMNNAYKSENPNPHVHWHLLPRYNHKIEFENIIFEDKEFGHQYDRERKQIVSDTVRQKIVDKIKKNF